MMLGDKSIKPEENLLEFILKKIYLVTLLDRSMMIM